MVIYVMAIVQFLLTCEYVYSWSFPHGCSFFNFIESLYVAQEKNKRSNQSKSRLYPRKTRKSLNDFLTSFICDLTCYEK